MIRQKLHNFWWRSSRKYPRVAKFVHSLGVALLSNLYRIKDTSRPIALCCIGKCENDYIREFVEYYKCLGFDKIYLYDNNDLDGERFEYVIGDYINQGFVELTDYRGRLCCQLQAYDDCYLKHGKDVSWMCFFDCDEFLTLPKHCHVKEFFSLPIFNKYQIMHINWMCYGDCEQLDTDGRGVLDRFPNPKPFTFCRNGLYYDNDVIKSCVRGGLKFLEWHSPHVVSGFYKCCNAMGNPCEITSTISPYNFDNAYLRHYMSKSIGEWVRVKMKRGYPDQSKESASTVLGLNVFFHINEKTPEKIEYANRLMN